MDQEIWESLGRQPTASLWPGIMRTGQFSSTGSFILPLLVTQLMNMWVSFSFIWAFYNFQPGWRVKLSFLLEEGDGIRADSLTPVWKLPSLWLPLTWYWDRWNVPPMVSTLQRFHTTGIPHYRESVSLGLISIPKTNIKLPYPMNCIFLII